MSRTVHIDVELVVPDDVDDYRVADAVLNILASADPDTADGQTYESVDGAEPIRPR